MLSLVEQNTNQNLNLARKNKNDEFYTNYNDVEKELQHYIPFLKGKRIICPCDNDSSAFVQYFKKNQELIKYKSLNYSHIASGTDFKNIDYSQYDVVITNPPFSLFREFINTIIQKKIYFLVIGNKNAITYKEIFKLFQNNQLWFGYNTVRNFTKPNGEKQRFGNIGWFTNIPNNKSTQPLELTKAYSKKTYPKYDNYDAIEVSSLKDIPSDYYDTIGVPVSYFEKHCPEQFDILDNNKGNDGKKITINGKKPYYRAFIKRKK